MDLVPVEVIFDSITVDDLDAPAFTVTPSISDVVGFSLKYANVPFTYYVVDESCNSFIITPSGGANYTISVESGTYNAVNLITELTKRLQSASVPSYANYVFFVDNTDSKLKVYNNSNAFTLSFVGLSNPANDWMGFSMPTAYASTSGILTDNTDTSVNGGSNTNYVSGNRVVNLSGPNLMFLKSSKLGSLAFGTTRTQNLTQPTIGFWPVNSNYQGTITFFKDKPQIVPFTPTTITDVDLKLSIGNRTSYTLNSNTKDYLSLNGEGFQICIIFWKQSDSQNSQYSSNLGDNNLSTSNTTTSQIMKPYRPGFKRPRNDQAQSSKLR